MPVLYSPLLVCVKDHRYTHTAPALPNVTVYLATGLYSLPTSCRMRSTRVRLPITACAAFQCRRFVPRTFLICCSLDSSMVGSWTDDTTTPHRYLVPPHHHRATTAAPADARNVCAGVVLDVIAHTLLPHPACIPAPNTWLPAQLRCLHTVVIPRVDVYRLTSPDFVIPLRHHNQSLPATPRWDFRLGLPAVLLRLLTCRTTRFQLFPRSFVASLTFYGLCVTTHLPPHCR